MMLQEAIIQSDLPPLHAETHRPTGTDPILPSDIGAETPQGAQQRADMAENNAKSYTDNLKTYIEANYQPVIAFPTAGRPLDVPVGFMGFDTDLGLPIWWNGTDWIDASGNIV